MFELINEFLSPRNAVFGVCHAGRLDDARYGGFTPFVNADIEKRVNPQAVLPGAKSVIVAGFAHFAPEYNGQPLAELSSLGVNDDYHKKIKPLLHALAAKLQEKWERPLKYKALADSGTLDERALAVRAGLGFFGKNSSVITKEFGSFFNIGCLLTDIPPERLDSGEKYTSPARCPSGCRLCVDACPGRAISDNGEFNPLLCASYLTQKDGELTEEESKIIRGQLYGCDVCRAVCPFNARVKRIPTARTDPAEWLALSDEELIKKYAHTAMAWRGAAILKRNARASVKTSP